MSYELFLFICFVPSVFSIIFIVSGMFWLSWRRMCKFIISNISLWQSIFLMCISEKLSWLSPFKTMYLPYFRKLKWAWPRKDILNYFILKRGKRIYDCSGISPRRKSVLVLVMDYYRVFILMLLGWKSTLSTLSSLHLERTNAFWLVL